METRPCSDSSSPQPARNHRQGSRVGSSEQERDSEPLLHLAGAHMGQLLGFLALLPIWVGRDGEGDSAQGGQDSRNRPILLISELILFSSSFLFSIFSSPSRLHRNIRQCFKEAAHLQD